jgi:hypothetical protein
LISNGRPVRDNVAKFAQERAAASVVPLDTSSLPTTKAQA